jgi:Fe-S cluster assembly ATP-binding protein
MALLTIRNLSVSAGGKKILDGLDLAVPRGEIHVLMGPNGSGKSTLANALMGHPKYSTRGRILLDGKDLSKMTTEKRAKAGLFLALQYPIEIPGVPYRSFLKAAAGGGMSVAEFRDLAARTARGLGIDPAMLERNLNEGFSGGEKKRAEVLQMLLLRPKMAILDETDSGLDVDALKTVGGALERMRDGKFGALVITHNPRLLRYLKPDRIHIMIGGKIVRSGGAELARLLESKGFAALK